MEQRQIQSFFEAQKPKDGQKSFIGSMAKTDQYKILFPLIPNLIGSVSTNVSSMTSCLRHWQEPAKTVHGDFQNMFWNNIPKKNFGLGKVLDSWTMYPT